MERNPIHTALLSAILSSCVPSLVIASEQILDVEIRVRGELVAEETAPGESSTQPARPTGDIKSAAEDIIQRLEMDFLSIQDEAKAGESGQVDGVSLFCVKRSDETSGVAPEFLGFRRSPLSRTPVQDWENYRSELGEALTFFSKHLISLDIREARLQKCRYQDLRLFARLNRLWLPLSGVDLDEIAEFLPPSLESLEISNSGVSIDAISKLNRLPSLKRLTFRNCWLEGFFLLPGDRRAFGEFRSPSRDLVSGAELELENLMGQIKALRFLGCDENLNLLSTVGSWHALELVEIDPRGGTYGIHQIVRYLAPGREEGVLFFPLLKKMVIHVDKEVVASMEGRATDFPELIDRTLNRPDRNGSGGFSIRVTVTPRESDR